MAKKWYVIHTYSGHENKVKNYLENAIAISDLEERIGRVVVPTEEVMEIKDGRRMTLTKKFLPSYVLVEMEVDRDTWYLVTNVPGVTSFVGSGKNPEPLRSSEVNRILGQIDRGKSKEGPDVPYLLGDRVKVIDGPFNDFFGIVREMNLEKNKIKVMVSIFGRQTPVELDILQVESMPEEEQK